MQVRKYLQNQLPKVIAPIALELLVLQKALEQDEGGKVTLLYANTVRISI